METEKICKNCKWRTADTKYPKTRYYCDNPKIAEDVGQDDEFCEDALIYEYNEGGGFLVGERFGCLHFEQKDKRQKAV